MSYLSSFLSKKRPLKITLYRVALIDSFFCSKSYYQTYNLQVAFPLEKSDQKVNCHDSLSLSPAYHGHQVMMEIGNRLISKKNFLFFLINVFNPDGSQNDKKWKEAIKFINHNHIHLVITASGYFRDEKLNGEKFKQTLLAAAGNAVGPLAHRPQLFPQSSKSPHKYLAGSFYLIKKPLYSKHGNLKFLKDPLNMNQNLISFFMPGSLPQSKLSGTSLAVALGASFFLNHCAHDSFEICLKEKSLSFSFEDEKDKKRTHKTFPVSPYVK